MSSFDIRSLLDFKPPRYLCQKCKALLYHLDRFEYKYLYCPMCKVKYLPTQEFSFLESGKYLDSINCGIIFDNLITQGQKLAAIANQFNKASFTYYPPLRSLFEAINNATKFIHFTTYGLSYSIYGALKLKAQLIPIRGIASNIPQKFAEEINKNNNEALNLEMVIFEQSPSSENWAKMPHQKFIVIDGLLAFKGSANLTEDGWRKTAVGLDNIEIVTDIKEIVDINNKLFSPIWGENKSSDINEILMEVIEY